MPYTAQISRVSPACVLILVDQSRSMLEPFGNSPETTKDQVVADAVNRLIQNAVLRSAKAEGVRDYFHIGVIGYGHTMTAAFGDQVLKPISEIAANPLRVEEREKLMPDGAGGVIEAKVKFPVWYEARANGKTPMREAVLAATDAVRRFIEAHPESFPPIVLNLTDGMPTDGNPQIEARALRGLTTADGNVLMFNLMLATAPGPPVYFLHDEGLLTDTFSKLLFRMSSQLPEKMLAAARAEGFRVEPGSRGVVFNADPTAVVRFLDIGTRVGTPVR
jgi:hypothetical protein